MPIDNTTIVYPNARHPAIVESQGNMMDRAWQKSLLDTKAALLTLNDDIASITTQEATDVSNLTALITALTTTVGNLTPVATLRHSATSTQDPGWLLCDGQAVGRTAYSALFSAIGTTYGSGDGSTTFNVPDLRGRVLVGLGNGSGLTNRVLAAKGGEEAHTLQSTEVPATAITAAVVSLGIGTTVSSGAYLAAVSPTGSFSTFPTSAQYVKGGNQSHNNMQPFTVVNIQIKY